MCNETAPMFAGASKTTPEKKKALKQKPVSIEDHFHPTKYKSLQQVQIYLHVTFRVSLHCLS